MSPKTVLLIDDEDDIREVTALTLEMVGSWTVMTASNGSDGIERAREHAPDVILLDVMMPGLDGPSTFASLREDEQTSQIPVIFLTAKVRPLDRERFEALGVSGMICKPFDPYALPDEINRILGWS